MMPGPVPAAAGAPLEGGAPGAERSRASVAARVFRESSGRAVATLARVFGDIDLAEDAVQEAFAVAVERWPSDGLPPNPGGWIVTTARHKALDRLRRESTRPGREAEAVALIGEPEPETEVGPVARRPAAPHLHLLPPGTRPGGADRADPAADRRAADPGDRPRLPRPRADGRAAPGPRQAQDQGRGHPVPDTARPRAPAAPPRRPRGRLPRLQRGLYRLRRRQPDPAGARRRGDPPGQAAARADAGRARGERPARPAAAHGIAPRGTDDTSGRPGRPAPTRTAPAGTAS